MIATTHGGSLPRNKELTRLLIDDQEGRDAPGLGEQAAAAIADVVARQVGLGVDLVNDGEQSKTGYSLYIQQRLSGFEGPPHIRPVARDQRDFPDFADLAVRLRGRQSAPVPCCDGPVGVADSGAIERDLAIVIDAADRAGISRDRVFVTSASPGLVAMFFGNDYYASHEEFLGAIADAMSYEYRAITDAGCTLQLDCPDFAMGHNDFYGDLSIEEFRAKIALGVEAINTATAGIAPEQMRLHLCWGNYESPHTTDVALADIIDIVLGASPAGLYVEGANARHQHEWRLFESVRLPDDKYLIPGVIDTKTNYVEHPEVVAQRIRRYADIVGDERVVAGTDCGFETFVGRERLAPSIAWAKLGALVEGARLASA